MTGGGLLHTTPHCVVVTVSGAELASCASHWSSRAAAARSTIGRGLAAQAASHAEHEAGEAAPCWSPVPWAGSGRLIREAHLLPRACCALPTNDHQQSPYAAPNLHRVAHRSRTPLEHQPQQAQRCRDHHDNERPGYRIEFLETWSDGLRVRWRRFHARWRLYRQNVPTLGLSRK